VAIGFFREIAGKSVTFFELTKFMFPIGWSMTILIWLFILIWFKPEKKTIPGLKQKSLQLYAELGAVSSREIFAGLVVLGIIVFLSLQSFIPALEDFNKSAIVLVGTLIFFFTKILTINDLEEIPWNIILLFGGAMSIGFCLWETGAAKWLAINWLVMFQKANWFVFLLAIAFFVLIMTNFIMNVAAIAISMPVALVIAPYLNVAPEVVLYASLVAAGMPFLLLVGAAPNAIAYESKQFTAGEFFLAGIPTSIILMAVIGFAAAILWPLMGMPITLK